MTPKRRRGLSRFQRSLDQWILEAIHSGASTFDEILVSLPGVFPMELIHALHRLGRNHRIMIGLPDQGKGSAASVVAANHETILPPPHLLDFDWRFSSRAADLLVQSALELTASNDSILFVGTPTVALLAASRGVPRGLAFVEWNRLAADAIESATSVAVTHMDALQDTSKDLSSDLLIVDPPWYRDYMHSFLWAAARWCRRGGHVLVSIPPVGTRPEMQQEHASLLEFSESLGMERIDTLPAALPYVTPPFEINALLASGFETVHPMWRRGDLWIFQRRDDGAVGKPLIPHSEDWTDVPLSQSRMKIRFRQEPEGEIDPRPVELFDNGICSSVSRYQPARQEAEVWTSNNRAYRCKSPRALMAIARAIATPLDPETSVANELQRSLTDLEARRVWQAAEVLREIAALEREELLSFGHAYGGTRLARSAS